MQNELTALLRSAQPNAVCFGGAGLTPNAARWCGTEQGDPPGYPTIWSTAPSGGYNGPGLPPSTPGVIWNPSGVDITLQQGDHWFITPGDPIHPLSDLVEFYHKSVGCNGKLEVDFAVSRTGQLDPTHVARYAEFGTWMRACYDTPLASGVPGTALAFTLTLSAAGGAPVVTDRVMLREDLRFGQNVNGYLVEYDAGGGGGWQWFGNGTTVGNKRIHIRSASDGGAVNATRLRLTLAPGAFPPPYVQTVSYFAAFSPTGCSIAPSPKNAVKFRKGGLCLITNSTSEFPCGGGADNACPVFLGDCSDPTALWVTSDGTFVNLAVTTATQQAAGINIDCNSVAPGAVAKLLGFAGGANPLAFAGGQIVYTMDGSGNNVLCLDGGGGPYSPPCGKEARSSNQLAIQPCSSPSTQGWEIVQP
jgi:hypothetical protein